MLAGWRRAGEISDRVLCLLLTAVVDAADRVANISGTYGAFLKSWQQNTRRPIELRLPEVPWGAPAGRANRRDANELVGEVPCDVLYIDPPYNEREYAANYHVLEAIAERPFRDDLAALEAEIYGKSGLRPYERSAYCDPRRCETAFRDLVARARARHVIVSYNEEGILTREAIETALREGLGTKDVVFRPIVRKRFRSDADRAGRHYKVLDGRGKDEIAEWLIDARRAGGARRQNRYVSESEPRTRSASSPKAYSTSATNERARVAIHSIDAPGACRTTFLRPSS
jgi:adenine-specific DNA-methyltransferase